MRASVGLRAVQLAAHLAVQLAVLLAALLCLLAAPARAADAVRFATNWLAEAEHGGFYQALADGTYARYGLDVTIVPGGPQANNRLLLAAGKVEFDMGANLIQAFDAAAQGVPIVAVAAMFQKDPFVLLAHPGVGLDRLEDLRGAHAAFIGREALVSVFQWLRQRYGLPEAIVKPYTFNAAPFLADARSIQQGYATSEPFVIAREGGFQPNVFLLADHGYESYSTTIETRRDLIEGRPDLVQRFVDASAIGWYHYLYGDPAGAHALIKAANPDMDDALLAFSRGRLVADGIVDSGDSLAAGIGVMTPARVKSFFAQMRDAGLFKPDLDVFRAVDLRFVGHGVGRELRPAKPPAP